MHRSLLPALLALAACDTKDPADTATDTGEAPIEETTWHADADADGFGDPNVSLDAADQPSGYVADATDCNDGRADINPDADEVCDALDNDCDEAVDEDAVDAPTWYADADGDGYGDLDSPVVSCDQPSDTVTDTTDCNDDSADQYPEADEVCNGEDDDCDKDIDEDAVDAETWYADGDGDGYGDAQSAVESCEQPSGTLEDDTDCDDLDPDIHPGAEDIADGRDQDCDAVDGFIFSEDFESYAVGNYIGSLSYNFATWTTGAEGGSQDVQVTDEVTYDKSSRALRFDEDDGDDLVVLLGPASGSWVVEWMMYVETGAYFNLQGIGAPFENWQNEIHIDESGYVYDDEVETGDKIDLESWVTVEYFIDIDAGTQSLYLDGIEVISDVFTGIELGGIDFYPARLSTSESEDPAVFHIDNVVFSEVGSK